MFWAPSTYEADARQLNEPCQLSPKFGERYTRPAMPPLAAQPLGALFGDAHQIAGGTARHQDAAIPAARRCPSPPRAAGGWSPATATSPAAPCCRRRRYAPVSGAAVALADGVGAAPPAMISLASGPAAGARRCRERPETRRLHTAAARPRTARTCCAHSPGRSAAARSGGTSRGRTAGRVGSAS